MLPAAKEDLIYDDLVTATGLRYTREDLGMIFELDALFGKGLFYVNEMSDGRFSLRIGRMATPYQAKRIISLAFHKGRL